MTTGELWSIFGPLGVMFLVILGVLFREVKRLKYKASLPCPYCYDE